MDGMMHAGEGVGHGLMDGIGHVGGGLMHGAQDVIGGEKGMLQHMLAGGKELAKGLSPIGKGMGIFKNMKGAWDLMHGKGDAKELEHAVRRAAKRSRSCSAVMTRTATTVPESPKRRTASTRPLTWPRPALVASRA